MVLRRVKEILRNEILVSNFFSGLERCGRAALDFATHGMRNALAGNRHELECF